MDLKFPHHENERAQAVALGKEFARHWMHNGFVVDAEGEKMSKSLGNVSNLIDLTELFDPRAYRMVLLQSHYRGPIRVGQDNIDASVKALAGLDSFAARTAGLPASTPDPEVLAGSATGWTTTSTRRGPWRCCSTRCGRRTRRSMPVSGSGRRR
jgi:cysteinyl-tRNA synthetase